MPDRFQEQFKLLRKPRSYALVLLYFSVWAAKDVLIKVHLAFVQPYVVTVVVALAVTLSAGLFIKVTKQPTKLTLMGSASVRRISLVKVGALGICTTIALYASIAALESVGPVLYAVVEVIAYPICLSIIAFLLLGESIQRALIVGTSIAIVGFIIFQLSTASLSLVLQLNGIVLAIIASLFFALSLTIIKDLLSEGFSPEELVLYRFALLGVVGFVSLPYILTQISLQVLSSLLLIGVFGYAVPFALFFYGLKEVPVTTISIFVASNPLFVAFFAYMMLPDTAYTSLQLLSLCVMLFGLLYSILRQRGTGAR